VWWSRTPLAVWELPGVGWGSTPQLMSSTPPPQLCFFACLGVRNNPHRSVLMFYRCLWLYQCLPVTVSVYCYYPVAISYQYYKAFTFSHSTYMYCYSVTLLLKWQQNCGAIILYVYCVQHWLYASYSPASNPLWGGVLFPCKRVAAFPFVGRLTGPGPD